jgi:hypothetical protein
MLFAEATHRRGVIRVPAHRLAQPWKQSVRVCVRERLGRTRRPAKNLEPWDREHDFVHRGKLEIRIDDGKSMNAHAWQDGLTPLEQRVGEILPKVLRRIDAELRREAKRAAERKRDEEERRVAQAAEARRRDEAQRRARLVREAIRWRRARIVREFVAAVEQELMTRDSSPGVAEHLTQWRGWTAMVLKELDPLPRRIATELAAAASPVSRQTP